jgi:hypothetical protein
MEEGLLEGVDPEGIATCHSKLDAKKRTAADADLNNDAEVAPIGKVSGVFVGETV